MCQLRCGRWKYVATVLRGFPFLVTRLFREECLPAMSQVLLLTVCSVAFAQTSPWFHLSLTGGPTLDASSHIYDPVTNSIVVFGGADDPAGCFTTVGDTWILTNANGLGGPPVWQPVTVAGKHPPARNRASAVYDQHNNRMIVFGGASCGGVAPELLQDVWVLLNANGVGGTRTWMPLMPPAPLPAGRAEHSAVYDPNANTMTVFGGCNDGIMDVPNDVWVLTNANGMGGTPNWIPLAPTGPLPAARCSAVAAYKATSNPASSVMTIYGGCCPSLADLWTLNGANDVAGTSAWQPVIQSTPAPGARETGAFGYDADMNLLMFFGGYSYPGPVFYDDVWMLTDANDVGGDATWHNTVASGSPGSPPPGTGAGVYDPTSKRLMVMQDPADLWIMTTRNGIDVSCSAGVPMPSQLKQLQRAGIQYAVVEAPQNDTRLCPVGHQKKTAQDQLDAFANAGLGFKTAAYCFLYFDAADLGTGAKQATNCLNTITDKGKDLGRLNMLSFVALDVEGTSTLPSNQDAIDLITAATTTISAAGQRPIIYTNRPSWNAITGSAAFGSPPLNFKLWLTNAGTLPSLTPWPLPKFFGGWTTLSGKQYKFNAKLGGSTVDLDVFDPALFQLP